MTNGSGMHRVAESIAKAELALGLDSRVIDCTVESADWDLPADVHVAHTHLPNRVQKRRDAKVVWVAHGTPDHVFQSAVEAGRGDAYGHGDAFMLMQHWLRVADARVTFWPRHQWIYQRMVDKGTTVHCIPLGIDKAFWSSGVSRGKWAGSPSVLTAENPHYIKWPYDLFQAWPDVFEAMDNSCLHAIYIPRDMHRWFFPLVNANGASYGAHISPVTFPHDELKNVLKSVDYYIGLVRYGDFNHMGLQASVAGTRVISYAGNPYADFWITEGDQREMASQLTAILKGDVEARDKTPVPDLSETAFAMKAIYEGLLDDGSPRRIPVQPSHQLQTHNGQPRHRGVHRPVRNVG